LFQRLDAEEEEEQKVGTEHVSLRFGDPGTMIEDVLAFYKHWNSFSTLKNFGYKDKYKATAEDERRIKRAIEKEN